MKTTDDLLKYIKSLPMKKFEDINKALNLSDFHYSTSTTESKIPLTKLEFLFKEEEYTL